MSDIVLCALNARYQHTAFGLRCLRANLGALRERSELLEFDLSVRPADVVERILSKKPLVLGFGVYVWNVTLIAEIVELLATIAPSVFIVLGGPEVSHELDDQPWARFAHAIVQGEGEHAFKAICEQVLAGNRPTSRVVPSRPPPIESLTLPYDEYTDDDLRHRVLYVEASRGCPYSCEFCLSALDEKVRNFPLEPFLASMQRLLDRGAKHFKFVDRTFNLKLDVSTRILEFFLGQKRDDLFLHFEMVPDRFPLELRELVRRFPKGTLQFEVGIQTFDPTVSQRISRRQDLVRLEDNLRFLHDAHVHVHADLIAGLPGEDLATFAAGFDRLVALKPSEIQLGILKRLRGAPIARHTNAFGMRYASRPPYEVLQTNALSFEQLQSLKRFAKLWDSVANSGNFIETTPLLLSTATSAFEAFSRFSTWLFEREGKTSSLALLKLAELLVTYLDERGHDARQTVLRDYQRGGRHEVPGFLSGNESPKRQARFGQRQARHRS